MGAYIRNDKSEIEKDLEKMFEMFPRLSERKSQLAGTMSGGEQQMLAIARALMSRPTLLLMDEPSMGLAPLIVQEIFEIIKKINKEQGTTIKDTDTNLIICDLVSDGQECVVAHGGRGGKGNAAFMTNKNKAPYTSELGEPGEERNVLCELKLLADVGLVGFPSVGKSSLISVISAAKPKIADYHFTTLVPNLGVVKAGNFSYVVADLPGMIEGSSEGIGLGDKFLRHASRCKVVAHVLDMAEVDGRNVIDDYKIIRNEIKKYDENLYNKKEIIVANKMDLPVSHDNLEKFKKEFPNAEIIEVSAATRTGTKELIFKLKELLESLPEEEIYNKNEFEDYVLYEFKHEKPYRIQKIGEGKFRVTGDELEKLLKMTRFNSDESALRFASKLKRLGIDDELKKLGAKEGDTVQILDQEFEYEERLY